MTSLEDALNQRLDELALVREEHMSWYGAIVRQVFYGDPKEAKPVAQPELFTSWHQKIYGDGGLIRQETVAQLKDIHDELQIAGDRFDSKARATQQRPPEEDFDNFTTLFEEFLKALGRIVRDCLMEDSGIDSFTGLRSRHVLMHDLAVEMERLERQGRPFCIALIRIDHFTAIQTENDAETVERHVKAVAEVLRESIRSFDDAFAYNPGEFVLSLKQTDVPGGVSTVERLRREVELEELEVVIGGNKTTLTMSCCVASPFEGDEMEALLKNLRVDLDGQAKREGSIVQYQEISPLQRFMQNKGE